MTRLMKYFGMYAAVIAIPVSGLSFTFTRENILLGSTGTQTLSCKVDETDVGGIYSIKMYRETVPGSNIQEDLATMDLLDDPDNPKLLVTQDGFAVVGNWDNVNFQETFLEVNMDIAKFKCNDARQYKCDLSYAPSGGGSTNTVTANATFSAYVEPKIKDLEGRKNGFLLPVPQGSLPPEGSSLENEAKFEIGDLLKLTCSTQIGSKPDTKIEWRKTSEIGDTDVFNQYKPLEGSYTEGAALNDNQCGYERTATITYNTSAADAKRKNNLIFECYVTVSGTPYTTSYTSQKRFYVKVRAEVGDYTTTSGGNEDNKVTERDVTAGAVGGMIVAVVIIGVFVIVAIVRRKLNTTETQRTRLQTDISYVGNTQMEPRAQIEMGLNGQAPMPNTYEQLHNTAGLEHKNVYDSLKADSEGSSGSKVQYERLQHAADIPSTYTALTTATLNKDDDRTYTNLQVENSVETGEVLPKNDTG